MMELNLRKARKLESKISKHINQLRGQLNPDKSVRINADIKTEVLPELIQARQDFLNMVENINQLIEARFLIRRYIGEANESSGINSNINNKVVLEHKLSAISAINFDKVLNSKELEDESTVLRTHMTSGNAHHFGGVDTSFSANFLEPADSDTFKTNKTKLVKEIEEIEDKLLELNYNTKIKLGNDLVTLLQTNSLV